MLAASELIVNADQSIYHLGLLPEDIADTILLVGDPGRVTQISDFFDTVEIKKQNREFITHTGYYHNKRIKPAQLQSPEQIRFTIQWVGAASILWPYRFRKGPREARSHRRSR